MQAHRVDRIESICSYVDTMDTRLEYIFASRLPFDLKIIYFRNSLSQRNCIGECEKRGFIVWRMQ